METPSSVQNQTYDDATKSTTTSLVVLAEKSVGLMKIKTKINLFYSERNEMSYITLHTKLFVITDGRKSSLEAFPLGQRQLFCFPVA